jgi:hypothetical protein
MLLMMKNVRGNDLIILEEGKQIPTFTGVPCANIIYKTTWDPLCREVCIPSPKATQHLPREPEWNQVCSGRI